MLSAEFGGSEEDCFEFHRRFNSLEIDYYPNKPQELDRRQQSLLNTFYSLRREAESEAVIKRKYIEEVCESNLFYEVDIASNIIQSIDDHYLNLRAEKMKADLEKSRAKNDRT
jgi:hypothetical protein